MEGDRAVDKVAVIAELNAGDSAAARTTRLAAAADLSPRPGPKTKTPAAANPAPKPASPHLRVKALDTCPPIHRYAPAPQAISTAPKSPASTSTPAYPAAMADAPDFQQPTDAIVEAAWARFKTTFRFDDAFASLQGTERQRYARALHLDAAPRRVEDGCEALVHLASRVVLERHQSQSQPPSSSFSPSSLGSTYAASENTVLSGLERFESWRAAQHVTAAENNGGQQQKKVRGVDAHDGLEVHFGLARGARYEGYAPGEYILRLVVGHPGDGCRNRLVGDGCVPFTARQRRLRFEEEVFPAVVQMVVAFLGFDFWAGQGARPGSGGGDVGGAGAGGSCTIPLWLEDLRRAPKACRATPADMALLKEAWVRKFGQHQHLNDNILNSTNSRLPLFVTNQCYRSRSKIWEAAWLLHHGKKDGWELEHRRLAWFLEQMTGGARLDELADLYRGQWLLREAEARWKGGHREEVLIYKWDEPSSIHELASTTTHWTLPPSPGPYPGYPAVEDLIDASLTVLAGRDDVQLRHDYLAYARQHARELVQAKYPRLDLADRYYDFVGLGDRGSVYVPPPFSKLVAAPAALEQGQAQTQQPDSASERALRRSRRCSESTHPTPAPDTPAPAPALPKPQAQAPTPKKLKPTPKAKPKPAPKKKATVPNTPTKRSAAKLPPSTQEQHKTGQQEAADTDATEGRVTNAEEDDGDTEAVQASISVAVPKLLAAKKL